nr:putative capsid [Marmot picobirnavirus]
MKKSAKTNSANSKCKENGNFKQKTYHGRDRDQLKKKKFAQDTEVSRSQDFNQDPFWYAEDQRAIQNMANFPFLDVVGKDLGETTDDNIPCMLVARYVPAIGGRLSSADVDNNSYLTRAAHAYFQYVAQGFTGDVPFESPDLLMTAIAGSGVLAAFELGRRAYGLMNYYLQQNTYYAKTAVESLGFNYEDLLTNMAEFRSGFNVRVNQVNTTIAVPKGFRIYDRWKFINSGIFTDSADMNYASLYAWVAIAAPKYRPVTMKTGTSLGWVNMPGSGVANMSLFTVQQYFDALDECINSLIDDDVRAIFGAVRRVYTDSDLVRVDPMEMDYRQPILMHDIVAMQFHNMKVGDGTFVGYGPGSLTTSGYTDTTTMLYQDANGNIKSEYGTLATDAVKFGPNKNDSMLLDLYGHLAKPENILDATTNMQIVSSQTFSYTTPGGQSATYYEVLTRSEFIVDVYLTRRQTVNNVDYTDAKSVNLVYNIANSSVTIPLTERYNMLTHIGSHPIVHILDANGKIYWYFGEIDKYTFIDHKEIAKLHRLTHYTLLAMPKNNQSVTK